MKNSLLSIIFVLLSITSFTQKEECASFLDSLSGREVYRWSMKSPEFPGGQDSLMQFIIKNIEYPHHLCVQGTAYAGFIVNKDGRLSDFRMILENNDFDPSVKKLYEKFPNWEPGICQGKPIDAFVIVPIKFGLK